MNKPKRPTLTSRPDDAVAQALRTADANERRALLRRAEGQRRLAAKVPRWAEVEALAYPSGLALEQCSSETTAGYKAELAGRLAPDGRRMVDLTGGLGVDFSFMAPMFDKAVYVEQSEDLCSLARHNFPLLGLTLGEAGRVEVVQADAEIFVATMPPADLVFIDPARRDNVGRKTVRIEDCRPDLTRLLPSLLERAGVVVAKLSPMLDIDDAVARLQGVSEVHIVGTAGECKEVVMVMKAHTATDPVIHMVDDKSRLHYCRANEREAVPTYAAEVKHWLYVPSAVVMKAGAFKWTAVRFGLEKLHPDTHLYTSDVFVADFPGRAMEVTGCYGFSKQEVKRLKTDIGEKANVAVRHFPETAETLRRRLKLKDGGDRFVFAVTMADGRHCLIAGRRPTTD